MKLNFRNLPSCGLPYDNTNSAMATIVKLFEKVPFLPELVNVDANDTLLNITLSNVPCIKKQGKKLCLIEDDTYKQYIKHMDITYNDMCILNLERFKTNSVFWKDILKQFIVLVQKKLL